LTGKGVLSVSKAHKKETETSTTGGHIFSKNGKWGSLEGKGGGEEP